MKPLNITLYLICYPFINLNKSSSRRLGINSHDYISHHISSSAGWTETYCPVVIKRWGLFVTVHMDRCCCWSVLWVCQTLKIKHTSVHCFFNPDGTTNTTRDQSPAGKPMTLKMRSNWSWWKGLLVFMSSCRQWKIGSDVNSSAKMQPIAQISRKTLTY